jgi:hypothetical protein
MKDGSMNPLVDGKREDTSGFPELSQGRRNFLAGSAGFATTAMFVHADDTFAMADKAEKAINQTKSEHARAESLPKEAFTLPRWIPEKTGHFNLNSVEDNHYAWAKVHANLTGGASWLAQYGWICICPPGQPAYPFLGRLTLSKYFATPAKYVDVAGTGPEDYVVWGTFTTIHVDPRTFEPVTRLRNPYTGKMIEPPTLHYADKLAYRMGKSIVVPGVDPAFYDQPWDRAGGYSQHNIDAGGEITYTVLGSAQKPSPQQPRIDVGFWTVKRDELMDPTKREIETRRDISVIQKMTEYDWYGARPGDEAQIFVHLTGFKTGDVNELPRPLVKHIIERNPERFGV